MPAFALPAVALLLLVAALAALIVVERPTRSSQTTERPTTHPTSRPMRIRVTTGADSSTFTATLYDNATSDAFADMLPLTITMNELNGNEKYADLSVDLPTNASNPGTIQSGDLMLFGSNTIVLFYKTFPTSYSYTRIGRIYDPMGLAAAVGSGRVTATFELE